MSYERKNGDIAIFKNKNRSGNQPEYTGTALDLQGNEVQISLWVKTNKNGEKFFSGKISKKIRKE